jgi:hypothetical protein
MAQEDEDSLPIIDMEFANEQTMGDPEFLKELLDEMLKDEETKVLEMEEGIKDNDHVVRYHNTYI